MSEMHAEPVASQHEQYGPTSYARVYFTTDPEALDSDYNGLIEVLQNIDVQDLGLSLPDGFYGLSVRDDQMSELRELLAENGYWPFLEQGSDAAGDTYVARD